MLFILSIASFLFSLLQFNTTQNYKLWLLSIASTEYGYWFGLIPLLGIGLCIYSVVRKQKKRFSMWYAVALGFIFEMSFVLLVMPLVQLNISLNRWNETLTKVFPKAEEKLKELPVWKDLFSAGLFYPKVNVQTYTYAHDGNDELKLDFYPANTSSPAPWVLVIHGGGWDSGSRKDLDGLNFWLANHGFSVASMDYRLVPKSKWPAPLQDAVAAVSYLKSNAQQLNINANLGAVLGRSAGGQIAESLAYGHSDPSIKALIAFYSPADMDFAYKFGTEDDIIKSRGLIRAYMGGSPEEYSKQYQSASPINDVKKSSPPTLLFHGPRDPMVWVKQSRRLSEKLTEAGVKNLLIEIPWATHGFDYNLYGPGGQLSSELTLYFLKQTVLR